ncbi:MAG: T9SS type A sorting domain-containing protein [Bacteroidales bacterium]|nr:T9SS type A sorting domain-containing protein [Bacteroidales bacterium]
MKQSLFLLIVGLLLLIGNLNAQVMYSDDFESYTVGQGIALQEGNFWDTWTGQPGTAEDPTVSDLYAFSGTNSVLVSGTNDGVIEFPDYTTGRYRIEFYIMVPTGKLGYYNIMQNFNPSGAGLVWGMQVMLKNGIMSIDGMGYGAVEYTYTPGAWFKVQHFIDLNEDWVDMYIDDVLVHAYQWSKGAGGTGNLNKLDAIDFYAWDDDGAGIPEYYMDNFLIEEVGTPASPLNFAFTIENGNDIVLTWEEPTSETPINYSVARNGTVIKTTTELSFTDLNVYPKTYNYSLLAYYGTVSGYSAPLPLEVEVPGGNERNFVTYEIFTSVNCIHCPKAAGAIDEIVADGNNVVVMEYHGNGLGADPFSTDITDYREQLYVPLYDADLDGFGYPTTITNGAISIEGVLSTVALMKEYYKYNYDEQIAIPTVYTIETAIQQLTKEPYSFNLDIDVTETFAYFSDETRLFIALTETDIEHSWQSETHLNFVVRANFPDKTGILMDFSTDANYTTNITIPINASYDVDNCSVIVFLQNMITGHVQQVSKQKLFSSSNIAAQNKFNTLVFPNPVNNILNIVADENISNIEVINMTGQVISYINANTAQVRLDVSNFASGIYFVKVYTQAELTTHKITVE